MRSPETPLFSPQRVFAWVCFAPFSSLGVDIIFFFSGKKKIMGLPFLGFFVQLLMGKFTVAYPATVGIRWGGSPKGLNSPPVPLFKANFTFPPRSSPPFGTALTPAVPCCPRNPLPAYIFRLPTNPLLGKGGKPPLQHHPLWDFTRGRGWGWVLGDGGKFSRGKHFKPIDNGGGFLGFWAGLGFPIRVFRSPFSVESPLSLGLAPGSLSSRGANFGF